MQAITADQRASSGNYLEVAPYRALVANWPHRWVRSPGSGNNVMPMIERARLRMAKRANHVKWLLAGIMALGALAPSVYGNHCHLSAPTEIF
jgi:hypothetical protein